jgi:hypothetical protein
MTNGLTPTELEWILRQIEQWLDDLWRHLSPSQQAAAREAFDRARAALAQARAAAGSAASLAAVREAMEALIRRLAGMGVRLTLYFQRLVDILGRFVSLFEAGAGGGGAGGIGGAAGAGMVLTEILVVMIAIIAVFAAALLIYREVTTEIEDQPGGVPCGLSTKEGREMATVDRTLTVWGFGRRNALKKAFQVAAENCADDSEKCAGKCNKGNCKPVMSVQSYDLTWFFAATRASVTFRCPCGCVERQDE